MINISKNNQVIIKPVLVAVVLILMFTLMSQLVAVVRLSTNKGIDVSAAIEQSRLSPEQISEALAPGRKITEALKAKNMFMPPPPKPQPPTVKGILGQEAFINGQWKKVGDQVGGALIKTILPMKVIIEWEGKELEIIPMISGGQAKPVQREKKDSKKKKKKEIQKTKVKNEAETVVVNEAEEDDLAWLDIPAHLKEKFREHWNQMTDEQKEEAKEQWNQMSQEQKDQAIDAWSQHL